MHCLTFDLEDWFHILDLDDNLDVSNWSRYESHVERMTGGVSTSSTATTRRPRSSFSGGLPKPIQNWSGASPDAVTRSRAIPTSIPSFTR